MNRPYIALLLALVPTTGTALEPWTPTDTGFSLAYTALHLADYSQTLAIGRTPGLREINPILGTHPSDTEVTVYFAATLAVHWGVARLLPQPWRRLWQVASSLVEVYAVCNNLHVGTGFAVPF